MTGTSVHVRRWAPAALYVSVSHSDGVMPLAPDVDRPGWFGGDVPLHHGSRYEILLDGAPVPDMLARWLPEGVHGAGRWWDPHRAPWSDAHWQGRDLGHGACVYELHVGTFTAEGTLDAAAGRLPHLVSLGVTHVELMPLAAFDGPHGWGYDGVALAAVHDPYGGPDALCRFVDAAHAHGLAVLLDLVLNHLGPSGNYSDRYGPLLTEAHHTPWGPAVNLDVPGSDDVRSLLLDVVDGWVRDFHLDGVRLDAVHELRDDRALTFLEEVVGRCETTAAETGRPVSVVAESDRNDPRTVTPRPCGLGLTAQWDDDVHHALHWMLTGETDGYYKDFSSADAAARTLTRAFRHDGCWSSFRGRTHGRPADFSVTPPWRFVASVQTHDQVGNRARGERLSHLAGTDAAAAGAALLLSLPYTPMLFMGEEWAASTPWLFFSSFPDAELGTAVTQGRRAEFDRHGWSGEVPDPQDPRSRDRSVLRWAETAAGSHAAVLDWYRVLLGLRRTGLGRAPEASAAARRTPSAAAVPGLVVTVDGDESGGGRASRVRVDLGPWTTVCDLGAGSTYHVPAARPAAVWGRASPRQRSERPSCRCSRRSCQRRRGSRSASRCGCSGTRTSSAAAPGPAAVPSRVIPA